MSPPLSSMPMPTADFSFWYQQQQQQPPWATTIMISHSPSKYLQGTSEV